MPDRADYYNILGVAPNSDAVVIRAAYRALMLKYHPDTRADQKETGRAQKINEAYTILGNAANRARYDSTGNAGQSSPSHNHGASGVSRARFRTYEQSRYTFVMSWFVVGAAAIWFIFALANNFWSLPYNTRPMVSREKAKPVRAASPSPTGPAEPKDPPAQIKVVSPTVDGPSHPELQFVENVGFDDIDAAAIQFDRVLQVRGLNGARVFSDQCHRAFRTRPTWSFADRCAGFDFAAAHVDSEMSIVSNGAIRKSDYFIFENENQSDNYAVFKAPTGAIEDRLARIRRAVSLAVDRVILDRLGHKNQVQRQDGRADEASH